MTIGFMMNVSDGKERKLKKSGNLATNWSCKVTQWFCFQIDPFESSYLLRYFWVIRCLKAYNIRKTFNLHANRSGNSRIKTVKLKESTRERTKFEQTELKSNTSELKLRQQETDKRHRNVKEKRNRLNI